MWHSACSDHAGAREQCRGLSPGSLTRPALSGDASPHPVLLRRPVLRGPGPACARGRSLPRRWSSTLLTCLLFRRGCFWVSDAPRGPCPLGVRAEAPPAPTPWALRRGGQPEPRGGHPARRRLRVTSLCRSALSLQDLQLLLVPGPVIPQLSCRTPSSVTYPDSPSSLIRSPA